MSNQPDINELIYKRQQVRAQKGVFYSKYKELSEGEKELDHQIMTSLMGIGTKKWETTDNRFQATIKDNPVTFDILDEPATIDWIKAQPEVKIDQFYGIRKDLFTPFARQMLKETGEVPTGTRINQTQSLLITDRTQTKQVEG